MHSIELFAIACPEKQKNGPSCRSSALSCQHKAVSDVHQTHTHTHARRTTLSTILYYRTVIVAMHIASSANAGDGGTRDLAESVRFRGKVNYNQVSKAKDFTTTQTTNPLLLLLLVQVKSDSFLTFPVGFTTGGMVECVQRLPRMSTSFQQIAVGCRIHLPGMVLHFTRSNVKRTGKKERESV